MTLNGIPLYPHFRQMTFGDRAVVEEVFSRHPSEVSERTFRSMFMWRHYEHRSELSQLDGHLLVSWYRERFGRTLLPPGGPDPASVIEGLSRESGGEGADINGVFGIVEPLVSELRLIGLEPRTLRDEWDYVYRTQDLIKLEGPKYHTQRKEMKKATLEHELQYEPMTVAHQKECLQLEETWCDLKHCTLDRFSEAEDFALKEAISALDDLGFLGAVVLVDGKLEALTVGEPLDDKTAVVHFEKANPMIRGLYQVINQQFCEKALKGYEFANREQDVGEPGLRRAKEGYHPHHFVEKHFLSFK